MYQLLKNLCAVCVAGLGIAGASTVAIEVADAPPVASTVAPIETTQQPEPEHFAEPFPDLSSVDWFSFWAHVEAERVKVEEERRIVRQMEIDEARMLYGQCGEWRNLALAVGWPPDQWETLSRVMYRESRCSPYAFSGSDAGLMQINRIHTEWASIMGWAWPDDLFIAENNLTFALRLYTTSGWAPWRFSGPVPD